MKNTVLVSRCDRLGDLILSLPALGLLRQASCESLVLHCSPYARDVAEWAMYNHLCDEIWVAGTPAPECIHEETWALSLFHCPAATKDFKNMKFKKSYGPRSKLSAIWSYQKTLAQHRSRVKKSEMEYNLDLVEFMLHDNDLRSPEFRGLAALKVPREWKPERKSPHTVVVVSNSASADNWPIEKYMDYARSIFDSTGRSLDFLVSGSDAHLRKTGILKSGLLDEGMGLVESFGSVKELISYLSHAKFVMSSSTGPLHIAHAAGVDVFGVYPSKRVQSFDRWRPYGYWHEGSLRYQII